MHPIVPFARAAYAQGWAATQGPLTDAVRAGCVAAIDLAVQHAEQPGVIEATLQLGALEGTWAAVYDRRERTHQAAQDTIMAAWKDLLLAGLTRDVVTAVRQHAGLGETRPVDKLSGTAQWIGDLLRRMFGQRVSVAGWHRLTQAVRDAFIRARSEGQTAALALLGERRGQIGFDFDLAFTHAYQALQHASDLTDINDLDGWLTRTLGDAADEVGGRLASLAAAGADYQDMVDAATDLLDTGGRSVTTAIDTLMSRAMSQGSLDLYRSEGVSTVDFLTAGDARVCPICSALEAGSPYPVSEAPLSGQHPWCRCAVAPSAAAVNAALTAAFGPGAAAPAETSPRRPLTEAAAAGSGGQAVAAALRRDLTRTITALYAVGAGKPGTTRWDEAVHQVRVGGRRARATLRVFRPLLDRPWARQLRQDLETLDGLLGPARDAAVVAARGAASVDDLTGVDESAAARIGGHLQAAYQAAAVDTLRVLPGRPCAALTERLRVAAGGPRLSPAAAEPADDTLPGLVRRAWRKAHRRARRLTPRDPPEDWHRTRRAARRARYAAQTARGVDPAAGKLAKRLGDVQTLLGEHVDAAAAAEVWARIGAADPDNLALAEAVGMLLEREQTAMAEVQGQFPEVWARAARRRHTRWLS